MSNDELETMELDDAEVMDLWTGVHFFNTPTIPKTIELGDDEEIKVNPDPLHHSTIAISTFNSRNLQHLPKPTWLIVHEDQAFYLYRITRPVETTEVERLDEKTGELKMGRDKPYNKLLRLEHNLTRIVNGEAVSEVPNPHAVLGDEGTIALWSGKTFTLPELESTARAALKEVNLKWLSLIPLFNKGGGESLSDAQMQQRREASAMMREAKSAYAMERSLEIIQLHDGGMTLQDLAKRFDISEKSASKKLWRARNMVGAAQAEPSLHCSDSSPEPEPLEVVPEPVKVHTEAPEPLEPTPEPEQPPAVDHTEALNALLASFKGSSGGPLGGRKDPVSAWS